MSRPRFGYLLPIYERRSGEHLAHVMRLLEVLSRDFDIEMALWYCRDEPDLPWAAAVHRFTEHGALRRWWQLRQLVRARAQAGCRRWFIRTAAFPALAIVAGGAETVYWLGATWRPRNPGLRGLVQQQVVNLAHRRVTIIATPPGMEAYNTEVWHIPAARQVTLDNDVDTTRYRPLADTERQAVRESLGVPADALMLLYVHRLTYWRGAHYLRPVLDGCRAAGQRVCLVAVGGDGDQAPALREFAAQYPEELKLLGHRPNDELPPLYAAADLFLMPSRAESAPRVILEAMACGTPLVSTNVGTVSRMVPPDWQDAAVVPPEDVAAFVEGVTALLGDTARRQAMGRAFRERAHTCYDVQAVAEQYRKLLTSPL